MPAKTTLTFVQNRRRKCAYPRTAEDFETLRKLGASLRLVNTDFVPLLSTYAKSKKVSVKLLDFEDLEQKALSNLESKWPGQFVLTQKAMTSIVLSHEKTKSSKDLFLSVKKALQKFYACHGHSVQTKVRKGSKSVKVTFTFVPIESWFSSKEH